MNVSTREAAGFFDIDKSTLTLWKRAGAAHAYVGRNRWNLRMLVDWWAEHIFEGRTGTSTDESLTEARRRYWLAKATREELRVSAERGELIALDEVKEEWAARVREVTSGLSMLSERLPPLVVGKERNEIREIIRNEIWHLRDQYARKGRYCPPPPEPEEKGEKR